MLPADCVCSILKAEHAQMRRSLENISEIKAAGRWRQPGFALAQIKAALEALYAFDRECHRPKERDVLVAMMRGRSVENDQLLRSLDRLHDEGDLLVVQALLLLDRLGRGELARADDLGIVLEHYRLVMLCQIKQEEGPLQTLARRSLGYDEWVRMAAMITAPAEG